MSATGYEFTCPKCGNERRFTASSIEATIWDVEIDTENGWDYYGTYSESDIHKDAELTCSECGYKAHRSKFEEEE